MFWLTEKVEFPPVEWATPEGILALGGDLSTDRLIHAYQNGIFPWFSEGDPIVWYCPSERMVLFPEELKISKSMKQVIKSHDYSITENEAFDQVIYKCKTIHRKGQGGTWITDEMEQAYLQLHELGYAKSIEVWSNSAFSGTEKRLVGGLYGLEMGTVFCGESMFSSESNTSKLAFIYLVQSKKYKLIDCQVYNNHLASLGAREIPRKQFLELLSNSLQTNL